MISTLCKQLLSLPPTFPSPRTTPEFGFPPSCLFKGSATRVGDRGLAPESLSASSRPQAWSPIEMQTRHGYGTERPIWPSEDMLPITVPACPGRDRHLPAWIDLDRPMHITGRRHARQPSLCVDIRATTLEIIKPLCALMILW